MFFEPDTEILIARSGEEVAHILSTLTKERAHQIGNAAYKKVIEHHTYHQRSKLLQTIFNESLLAVRI
jgi:spore maturation protein CgeB